MNYESIRYPRPLKKSQTVGVTAPSSGVEPRHEPRLDLVKAQLESQGFRVKEGSCLRGDHKHVSAPAADRVSDLIKLWSDPDVAAIIPPWGGELLIEMLPRLDLDEMAQNKDPKWILGYSDTSTLLFALTLKTGIATAHGSNLMDLVQDQVYGVTQTTLAALAASRGESFEQKSFEKFQVRSIKYEVDVAAPFNLSEPVKWKSLNGEARLSMKGRLIGGCFDTLTHLVGTPYGELPRFIAKFARDGVILYLENAEMSPCGVARALWNLRMADWFRGLSGIVFGRSAAPDMADSEALSYVEALRSVLSDLKIPVVYDADIGHRPPQFVILNGALGELSFQDGRGSLKQSLV